MSTLGQWFFEKEKASIMAALQQRAPYVATVATVGTGTDTTLSITDPFTGSIELERLAMVGALPKVGDPVIVIPLIDGTRVAMGMNMHHQAGSTEGMRIGADATQTLRGTAIGYSADAADAATAVGATTMAMGYVATAMGWGASGSGERSVAIGNDAIAGGDRAVAIGALASASAGMGVAIGREAAASGGYGIAMGYQATAAGASSVALGDRTDTNDETSIAIGYNAQALGYSNIAMGRSASTAAALSAQTAIGHLAASDDELGTAIGALAAATNRGTALGSYAKALADNVVAIGHYVNQGVTAGANSTAVGTAAKTTGVYSVAMGMNSQAQADRAIAIGYGCIQNVPDRAKIKANQLELEPSSGSGQTYFIIRSPNGTRRALAVSDTGVITANPM